MALTNIITAFGLAGAAGLNAYIPLLIVGILGKLGVLTLGEPFNILTSWPAIIIIAVLLIVEVVVDKVPGADHLNDVIQTIVRPAAGAVLFAANTGVVQGMDPTLALGLGLVMALSTHAVKAAARPVVNATTAGLGAPVVSALEDVTSATTSLVAIFLPPLLVVLVLLIGYLYWRWRIRGKDDADRAKLESA